MNCRFSLRQTITTTLYVVVWNNLSFLLQALEYPSDASFFMQDVALQHHTSMIFALYRNTSIIQSLSITIQKLLQ